MATKYLRWLKFAEYIRLYCSFVPMTLQGYSLYYKKDEDVDKLMNGCFLIYYTGLTTMIRLWPVSDPLVLCIWYYHHRKNSKQSFLQKIRETFVSN